MDSIIKLDDMTIKEWEKDKIEFEVTDENENPLNGRVAVKINDKTYFNTVIENGKFSEDFDFSSFHEEKYSIDVIFGGNNECAPSVKNATITIEKADPILFSIVDLQNACYRLIKWIDTNKRVPGKILINNQEVTIGNLLKLLVTAVSNINENNPNDVELTWVQTPTVSQDTLEENKLLTKEEYITITKEIQSVMANEVACPESVNIEDDEIGFMNLVYIYSTIITNSSPNNGLLSGVYIKPWKEIVA